MVQDLWRVNEGALVFYFDPGIKKPFAPKNCSHRFYQKPQKPNGFWYKFKFWNLGKKTENWAVFLKIGWFFGLSNVFIQNSNLEWKR
jgi:hypothetical protein